MDSPEQTIINLQETNSRLQKELEAKSASLAPQSIDGVDVLTLRIGSDGIIHYLNTPMARYLGVRRDEVLGQTSEILLQLMDHKLIDAMNSLPDGTPSLSTVQDQRGTIFELRAKSKDGFLDVVMNDVTHQKQFLQYVNRYLPSGITALTEEEMASFKFPERRHMTVSFTDLRGFTTFSEQLPPDEIRSMLNAYLEETIAAIEGNGATLDKIIGDEVIALYGAPKYYSDHPLRAVKTACDQVTRMGALKKNFAALGKQIPGCGVGINTGDMVLGNLGTATRQNYTVIGTTVNVAARLSEVARPGEILISEATLASICECLPVGWQAVKARTDYDPDIKGLAETAEAILPLNPEDNRLVFLIGPGMEQNPAAAEFYFQYLCRLKLRGIPTPTEVISVWSARGSTEAVILQGDTISISTSERAFGRYRLVEILGRGGMGEVWKSRDAFGNIAAIKMMRSGGDATDGQVQRFKREADIMSRLKHRNLCRIYEVGTYEGVNFIAMEYLEGATLSEILALDPPLDASPQAHIDLGRALQLVQVMREEYRTLGEGMTPAKNRDDNKHQSILLPTQQVISIICRICDALQAAHEQGVLHRDLKPGNIMIRPDGDPIVMDFGLAKIKRDQNEVSLSLSNQIIGTIEYMAPEQAQSSKDIDERADIYSLGSILYQMLTGRRHFQSSGNILADAQALQIYEPPRPRSLNPSIDPDLELIVLKALRPDPSERYRSAAAFKDDLERYRKGESIHAKEVSLSELALRWLKRNKSLAAFVAFLLTVSLAFIALLFAMVLDQKNAAQKTLKELRSLSKQTAQDDLSDGRLELDRMNFSTALEKSTAACELDPNYGEGWLLRAKILIVLGKFSEALSSLQQLNSVDPALASANSWILDECEKWSQAKPNDTDSLPESLTLQVAEAFTQHDDTQMSVLLRTQLQDTTNALLRDFSDRLIAANPGLSQKDVIRPTRTPHGVEIHLRGLKQLHDLSPLRGLPISKLEIDSTSVSQLDPLQGLPIRSLSAEGTPIADLTPLKGMPLSDLNIADTRVSDLSPLAHSHLEKLNLRDTNIDDLSPLKGLHLKELDLSGTPLIDLNALGDIKVDNLSLARTNIDDLSPLHDSKVRELDLTGTPITDLSTLQGLPLDSLNLSSTKIRDLTVLSLFHITSLDISNMSIHDLSPLRGLRLKTLNLANNPISDLSPLTTMPLTDLDISGTKVTTLQELKGLKLKRIILSDTEVPDLNVLRGMPLKEVRIGQTPITDLSPLAGMALNFFSYSPSKIKSHQQMNILRQMSSLQSIRPVIDSQPSTSVWLHASDFWKQYDAGEIH